MAAETGEPIATVLEWFIGILSMIILAWNGWISRNLYEHRRVFAEELEKVKESTADFADSMEDKMNKLNENVHHTQLDIAKNMVTKADLKDLKDGLYELMSKSEARLTTTVKQTGERR